MEPALVLGGLLLGFGGSAHCAAMCGAPCAALTRGGANEAVGFHAARAVGYMAAGAVAAASVSSLAAAREAWPVLRPLWTAVQILVLTLGLWLLATGRQPDWRFGRVPALAAGWAPVRGPVRSGAVGLAWVAWPCGLLHSALLLAALASGPAGGAAVMGAFALGSLPALAAGPWMLNRLAGARGRAASVRVAGALLVAASGFALGHGVWQRVWDWCVS